jgi:FkbM family methyltransferase
VKQFLRKAAYVPHSIWQNQSNRGQRWRRLLMFVGWQLWKRLVRLPVVVPVFNGLRFVAYPDCQVSSGFVYYRIPDYREIAFLRSHLNGGTLVDVGANVGSVSILLADRVQHAFLFEPNPAAAARARENLAVNGLGFTLCQVALSDSSGTVELEDSGGVSTTNRTVIGFQTSAPTRLVPRITFDEFLRTDFPPTSEGAPGSITMVKIDVEGHENAVLRGMEHFLRQARPRLIMFEYLQRTNLAETIAILDSVDYRVFELIDGQPSMLSANVKPLQNLFACPSELVGEFVAGAARDAAASAIGVSR